MARGKKVKKLSIVDLRMQPQKGPLKTLEMGEAAFKSTMKKEKLICFKYATYEKLFGGEQGEGEGEAEAEAVFADVWCPAVFDHQDFRVLDSDDIVFVDVLDTKYTPLISLLKTKKLEDEKKRSNIAEALLREEQMEKICKKKSSIQSTSEEVIVFIDVRSGGGTCTLPVKKFMEYVKDENVVCYNHTAYAKVYKVENPLECLHIDSPPSQVWIPGRGKLEDFLLREVVYVDNHGPLQACVLEEEQEQQPEFEEEQEQPVGETADFEEDNIEQGQYVGKQQEDDGWQQVQSKGSKATIKEVLHVVDGRLCSISDSMALFMEEVRDMKRSIKEVKQSVVEINASVSRNAERACRLSFAEFYERLYPGVDVAPPITNKVLPYTEKAALEALGKLCSISGLVGEHMCAHPSPLRAEIDILLKLRKQGAEYSAVSPDIGQGRVPTTSADDDITVAFSHAVLGEVTRSIALCASSHQYRHPTKLSNNPSSKLLYKFVQLERGIIATMEYYNLDADCIGGAAIISPSFARLAQPRRLAGEVLNHCPAGLENVRALYDKRCFWLLDI